ncbi:hypothetical protein HG530_000231 [Fusarium avenaceum]|nr:hypothetical protein HG530_000231 [Fusarium avenaceum]
MAPSATINSYSDTAHEKASGFIAYARNSVDRVVPPSSRQQAYDNAISFASSRPVLFSFIVSQLLLCLLPLLIFLTFSVSTIVFVLGVAAVFALFWIGVALLILVPALIFTSSIAVLVWGWAVGSFVIARWLYMHSPTLRLTLLLCTEHSFTCGPEVRHLHPHTSLSKGQQTGLGAYSLDVGTRKVIFLRNELLEIDVVVKAHLGGVECENLALGVLVRVLKENLSIDTTRSNQSRIQGIDLVGGHNDLDVTTVIKTVQLVEQFQHKSKLSKNATYLEELSHKSWAVTKVLLDKLTTHDAQESGRGLVGNGLCQQVGIVGQNTNNTNTLVMQKHTSTGLQKVFVDKAHDADVVLRTGCAAHDGVVIINELL